MISLLKKFAAISALLVAATFTAQAAVVQSIGSGSAVSAVDAVANFENMAALYGNPYIENGISFSRTGLTFNNNGCGYAGCLSTSFRSFTGNYMYGYGLGYFQMAAESGKSFQGLEFITGSGYGGNSISFVWEAALNGNVISSGTGIVSSGTVLGFFDTLGFDTLRWTETSVGTASFTTTYNAPAFDNVKVQYVQEGQAVPEPATVGLLGLGLLGVAVSRRNSAKSKNA